MSSIITVNPSTTLILLKNPSSPTYVYLPTLNTNDFQITIRDITGSGNLQTSPAIISTTSGARFLDGTTSYAINQPYGLVNIGLRTSTIWQILHTSGQEPATSAANVDNLNISTTYVTLHSSFEKYVSSIVVENLFTPNPIILSGSLIIDNLSTIGSITLESTLTVYNDVTTFGNVYVSGATNFLSSVFINTLNSTIYQISGYSNLGVAGDILVKDTLDIRSTLTLASTVQVDTLQVTRSSGTYSVDVNNLQVADYVSTLLNLGTQQSTVANNITISKDTYVGGTLTTKDLVILGTSVIGGNLSTFGDAIFYSSLRVEGAAVFQQDILFASTFATTGTLHTLYFSTPSLSTFSNINVTQSLSNVSTLDVLGNISSIYLQVNSYISVGKDLTGNGSLSSFFTNTVLGNVNIGGDALIGSLLGNGTLGVGGMLDVNESTIVSDLRVQGDFTTDGNATVGSLTQIGGSMGVGSSIFVTGNLKVNQQSFISSFELNSFLLSNLRILTSSPFTSFTASSLNASTIYAGITQINLTDLQLSSVYASTLLADNIILDKSIIESLYADKAYFASDAPSSFIENIDDFFLYKKTFFLKGISSFELRTNSATGDLFEGVHIGDGAGLSNVPFNSMFISTNSTIASTVTSINTYTSTFNTLDLYNYEQGIILSSIVLPEFVIQGIGYPIDSNQHQILMLSPSTMVVNNTLFFDRDRNYIGINVSSPQYDLDIGSGSLAASNLFVGNFITQFSVIQTVSPVEFSSLQVSSIFVRDGHSTNRLYVGSEYNNTNGLTIIPSTVLLLSADGHLEMYQGASSIGIGKGLHIYDTNKVGINTVGWNTFFTSYRGFAYEPIANLEINSNAQTQETYTSTVDTFLTVTTPVVYGPNLNLYSGNNTRITRITNEIKGFESTISLNNTAYIQRPGISTNAVGLLTSSSLYTLDVNGDAFFSSLNVGTLYVDTLLYSYGDI